ncbi:MAG: formate acetyltransferase [Deltaproteobacteria bacterium]|nr:formate acetyltransferase [Deltaproteobacteria bacterium]
MRSIGAVAGTARSALLEHTTSLVVRAKLAAVAALLNHAPSLRHHLQDEHPLGVPFVFEAKIQFVTWDRSSGVHVVCSGGRMRVGAGPVAGADATVRFKTRALMRRFFDARADNLDKIINNDVALEGNMGVLAKFGHMTSAVALRQRKLALSPRWAGPLGPARWQDMPVCPPGEPCRDRPEGEATWLADPHLAAYTLDHFPRIKRQLWTVRTTIAEICTERARLLTELKLRDRLAGRTDDSAAMRQARVVHHLLTRKEPFIREDDLLAGTTTSRPVGVPLYPELGATWGWGELLTMQAREINPYRISDEDIEILNREVYPFWLYDNVRQWTYARSEARQAIDLDMRFALFFMWKSQAISHTVVDVPAVLRRGLLDIRAEAGRRRAQAADEAGRDFYGALAIALDGVMDYACRLGRHAAELESRIADASGEAAARRAELREMARICAKVPAHPAETLHEAVQAIWILLVALHQESFNAALVVGRLDVWLQPFFARDLGAIGDPDERRRYVARALELCCALMIKCADHLPYKESAGNRVFSGSSADMVITLGGQTEQGRTAVCDMTWILLKATEMLRLRDPNVNARFAPGINSEQYLRRLCEVNLLTGATPSLHNDAAVVAALEHQGLSPEHARDWTATGCVEPTSCGRHLGHTNCMMFNLVAALEMALHDGSHPLLAQQVGPRTGDPRSFATYADFVAAIEAQLGWLIDRAVEANDAYGRAHQELKPTPLMSALFCGPMDKGRDVVDGGALYNSSGAALIGLTDVIDSLAAVRTLVYERRRTDWEALLAALAADFAGHAELLAEILTKTPKFGRDEGLPLEIARGLMGFVFRRFQSHRSYRGGRYFPGYWSMSFHVAFGALAGALPSGRRKGKAFTPGLTPSQLAGASLTEQIRTVAALDPLLMPNNIAFNVKVAPGPGDAHCKLVDRLAAYVGSYFELGGMQMQFNVVSTATLRAAMEHPEEFRDLLVRISGYNVYFVDLTREAQLEVIERTEHRLGS